MTLVLYRHTHTQNKINFSLVFIRSRSSSANLKALTNLSSVSFQEISAQQNKLHLQGN